MNCLTFLEYIYKQELGINFDSIRVLFKIDDLTDLRDLLRLNPKITDELKSWKKIDLTNLELYDIIVFKDRNNRIAHFGMYLQEGKFIHLPEKTTSRIQLFNEEFREKFHSAYRNIHATL